MNIAAYAGITTAGVDSMHDFQPSCDYTPSNSDMYDFTAAFSREMCELPNPYAITLNELADYIEYVTDWPSVVELQNGAASINNPVILKAISIIFPGYEFNGSDVFNKYSEIKNVCCDMIECIRWYLMEITGDENVQSDEFRYTTSKKLLSFFEAMAVGDRSHVDRFIRTFSF